jgi:hypothetical protein
MQGILHPRLKNRFLGFFETPLLNSQLVSVKLPKFSLAACVKKNGCVWLPFNAWNEVIFVFEDDLDGRVLSTIISDAAVALDSVKLALMDGNDTVVNAFWFNNPEELSFELEELTYAPFASQTSGELRNMENGEKVSVHLSTEPGGMAPQLSRVHVRVKFKSTRFLLEAHSLKEFESL